MIMNRYYDGHFGKNNSIFNKNYSRKGTYMRTRRRSASASVIDAILNFIDALVAFICSAKTRIIAKAVFGFLALVAAIGIMGRIQVGSIPLLAGCAALALIVALEFIIIRQK